MLKCLLIEAEATRAEHLKLKMADKATMHASRSCPKHNFVGPASSSSPCHKRNFVGPGSMLKSDFSFMNVKHLAVFHVCFNPSEGMVNNLSVRRLSSLLDQIDACSLFPSFLSLPFGTGMLGCFDVICFVFKLSL